MAEKRDNCVKELVNYLNQTYPGDNVIKQWQEDYTIKFLQKKPVLKRTRSVVRYEIKEQLVQSYDENLNVGNSPDELSIDTVENCIEKIKRLDKYIKGNKRNIIWFSVLQGQAINNLKLMKRGDIGVFLVQQGVPYSVSYCNSLIRLYKLVEKHNKLRFCAINLRLILQNMKTVEEICKELNW